MLIAIWHMLIRDVPYVDLGLEHFLDRLNRTRATHRLGQLNHLGYEDSLQPIGAA